MVGHPSAYWARRKGGEAIQLTEGDKQELVLAYQRSGSVRAAAKERRVHRTTAQKWISLHFATGSTQSPTRSNSGRPKTATASAVVAKIVMVMTAPEEHEYVPSAPDVKREGDVFF